MIHENRGLNPYIEDVARRAAVEGFLALAPDGLFPVGGYPGNDDDGRTLQARPRPGQAAHRHGQQRALSEGARAVHRQARRHRLLLGRRHDELPGRHARRRSAGGRAVLWRGGRDGAVPTIKAPLLIHYAENDERINAMWPAYEAALKAGERALRDAHLSGHAARLPQQLDAALPGGGGQARLGADHRVLQEAPRLKGGSLVAPQSQADILKRAVIIVVAGQANVGFLCKPRFCGEYQSCR